MENDNFCQHGCTYGYCAKKCIRFNNLKEKVEEQRRQFLAQFGQTPWSLEKLQTRKRWPKRMPAETKETFVRHLIVLHKLERQLKY